MKRLHVRVSVADLSENIRFYTSLFAAEPTIVRPDYAKWIEDDPKVHFAICQRTAKVGLNHLGIQVESEAELEELKHRLGEAVLLVKAQKDTACRYAKFDKCWKVDPQGLAWKMFHTLSSIPVFGEDTPIPIHPVSACCAPGNQTR